VVSVIELRFASLKETKVHEYAIRFLFGGLCTVGAGLIAKYFGPSIGGLFLAFPAIFPAAASLIASHEKERKAKKGYDGTIRGRMAASIDSAGASLGCIGLGGFAFVVYKWLDGRNAYLVISVAALVWLLLVIGLWELRKRRHWLRRRKSMR
jgi:MFS family permease